ncbi:hypothetical protein ACTXT7_000668 [Hymenolepis weldensis]
MRPNLGYSVGYTLQPSTKLYDNDNGQREDGYDELLSPWQLRNYGISDPGCVEAVRKVFDELDIPAIFSAYEDRVRVRILEMIDSMCTEETKDDDFTSPDATKLPKKFFVELLNLFYRRKNKVLSKVRFAIGIRAHLRNQAFHGTVLFRLIAEGIARHELRMFTKLGGGATSLFMSPDPLIVLWCPEPSCPDLN